MPGRNRHARDSCGDLPPQWNVAGFISKDRFILAGINRMRAISMTTFAAILALLPLALGIGQGSAMQQPLAIAIIAGLIFSLPLVLIVLPALLAMFQVNDIPFVVARKAAEE